VKVLLTILASIFVAGCSLVGQSDVETAPYSVLISDLEQKIEVRLYDPMILVSTKMSGDSGNSAFRKLFKYITGANEGATQIAMTAPVIMDNEKAKDGVEIAMTAPVFMNDKASSKLMSFVMPKDFTLATTPKPTNPDVQISELNNYRAATIEFSGTISDSNVKEYSEILLAWIAKNGYTAISAPVKAGYNGPLTIPMFRRNEVLIEIQ
jgi:hypothetical protein